MRLLIRLLFFPVALLSAALIMVPGALLAASAPGMDLRKRISRIVGKLLSTGYGAMVRARYLAPLPKGPCVVVANHASYLDGIILTGVLPPRFSFAIKQEVGGFALLGWVLRRLGHALVERFDRRKSIEDGQKLIEQARGGQALGFFPEGRFDRQPGLRPFRSGAFHAAAKAGIPVVPVVIRGSRDVLPSGTWLPDPGVVEVTVCAPIHSDGQGRGESRRLMAEARAEILARLDEPDLS